MCDAGRRILHPYTNIGFPRPCPSENLKLALGHWVADVTTCRVRDIFVAAPSLQAAQLVAVVVVTTIKIHIIILRANNMIIISGSSPNPVW